MLVACVYKHGGDFSPEYVRRLVRGVRAHYDGGFKFVCVTDRPDLAAVPGVDATVALEHEWPGWWAKIEALRLPGPCLYLDLDTMIVDDLGPWIGSFVGMTERIGMLSDFNSPMTLQSGVMFWREPIDLVKVLSEGLTAGSIAFRPNGRGVASCGLRHGRTVYNGDGPWVARMVGNGKVRVLNGKEPRRVVSYKKDVRGQGIPDNACVVCFHGHPRPHEALNDPIVQEHWR